MPFEINLRDKVRLELREKRDGQQVRTNLDLASSPQTNALSMAIRYLPRGWEQFLEYVELAAANGDPHAVMWWRVYADLAPNKRKVANPDDIAYAANVKPNELIAGMAGHAVEQGMDVANLMSAIYQPQAVKAMGESALRITGTPEEMLIAQKDRHAFLQSKGMIPVPKGTSIHLHANATSNANATAAAASLSEPSVPTFADDMESLTGPRPGSLLPAASEPILDGIITREAVPVRVEEE